MQAQYKARIGIQDLDVSIRTIPRGWVPRAKLITVISPHVLACIVFIGTRDLIVLFHAAVR
jgi:hypothetical protein